MEFLSLAPRDVENGVNLRNIPGLITRAIGLIDDVSKQQADKISLLVLRNVEGPIAILGSIARQSRESQRYLLDIGVLKNINHFLRIHSEGFMLPEAVRTLASTFKYLLFEQSASEL